METNPTNDEMSVKRSKNGPDLAKAFNQDAPYKSQLFEQGKDKTKADEFAMKILFVIGIAVGFTLCYYIGVRKTSAKYEDQLKRHDSIAYQTALTDIKNGKY